MPSRCPSSQAAPSPGASSKAARRARGFAWTSSNGRKYWSDDTWTTAASPSTACAPLHANSDAMLHGARKVKNCIWPAMQIGQGEDQRGALVHT